jgi:hypothetical protein
MALPPLRLIEDGAGAVLYTDSILHDPRVLRFVVEMLGADRVMMGSIAAPHRDAPTISPTLDMFHSIGIGSS